MYLVHTAGPYDDIHRSIAYYAMGLGGPGFYYPADSGHIKDCKNGTQYLPAWHSAKRVGLGGACWVTGPGALHMGYDA